MEKIILQNSFYQYVMAVDDQGHLFHCCFLPAERADTLSAQQWLARCPNPFPFEALVNVDREPIPISHFARYFFPLCTARAVYRGRREEPLAGGTRTVITLEDEVKQLLIHLHYEVYQHSPAIRRYTVLENVGARSIEIDHVASFVLSNFPYEDDDCRSTYLHEFASQWSWECQSRVRSFAELGIYDQWCRNGYRLESPSTWVCQEYFPYFVVEQRKAGLFTAVQIEHSSSWRFEAGASDVNVRRWYYIQGGMGSHTHAQWSKILAPGESFASPAASLTVAAGDLEEVYDRMRRHQQNVLIHRSLGDRDLPIIYNDWPYMQADVTERKIIEQLDRLKECGVEVYVTDSGWYTEPNGNGERSSWWSMAGHWQPNKDRFPHGLDYVVRQIKARGMRAGIWCEIEAVGRESEIYNDEELLLRRGEGFVEDASRRFLNFASEKGRKFADEVFDRIAAYGFEYVKIDYNIDSAPGCTQPGVDSLGHGLHLNRMAYYDWLDGVRRRHPRMIIENCSSGGMRLDYGMLSRTDMASITDQPSHKFMGGLLFNVSRLIAPCQCGTWSWLEDSFDLRDYAFALSNSMGGRMHLSGNLVIHDEDRKKLLADALRLYKQYRHILPQCRVHYHTAPVIYHENDRLRIMELAARTGDERVIIAQRPEDGLTETAVFPRDLADGTYLLQTFPAEPPRHITAEELNDRGLTVALDTPFSARVYYLKRES
ncbi:MAG: hypothetical protein E7436_01305 [Ruminococcaceae bacterium]|nr:hypothetical protein [Oscillospiraceae bacterium]